MTTTLRFGYDGDNGGAPGSGGMAAGGGLGDRLVDAVLRGEKTATSSLAVEYLSGEPLPRAGERLTLIDSTGTARGVVRTTAVTIAPLNRVDDEFAHAEGEGFADAAAWRTAHVAFWDDVAELIRADAGDPGWTLREDEPVVLHRFELIDASGGGTPGSGNGGAPTSGGVAGGGESRPESTVVAAGRPARRPGAPMSTPVVLAAPFEHAPAGSDYLRWDSSDTITSFEAALGALDGGEAIAFASGMAAVAAIAEGMPAGSAVVIPSNAYGGCLELFDEQAALRRTTVRRVDITDTDAVLAALPRADLAWLETVTNPLLGVADLPRLIEAAHAERVTVVVDATFSTPLLVRPLALGADVVMHSATKVISGHSDLLMGALVTADPARAQALRRRRGLTGAMPGALESYLALRGLRTLSVRLERAQANAAELARRLSSHPAVTRVRYPGLPDDPGHERASRLHDGYGSMISFETAGAAADAERVCASLQLIHHATSLGGVESLIERRSRHASDAEAGTPDTLLRLSVGIEHVEDLWNDLAGALSAVPH